jgi:hypothetical protein
VVLSACGGQSDGGGPAGAKGPVANRSAQPKPVRPAHRRNGQGSPRYARDRSREGKTPRRVTPRATRSKTVLEKGKEKAAGALQRRRAEHRRFRGLSKGQIETLKATSGTPKRKREARDSGKQQK